MLAKSAFICILSFNVNVVAYILSLPSTSQPSSGCVSLFIVVFSVVFSCRSENLLWSSRQLFIFWFFVRHNNECRFVRKVPLSVNGNDLICYIPLRWPWQPLPISHIWQINAIWSISKPYSFKILHIEKHLEKKTSSKENIIFFPITH